MRSPGYSVARGNSNKQRETSVSTMALVTVAVVVLGGIGFWYLDRQSRQISAELPVLTPEAKGYVRYLKLSGVEMKATDTFLGQTVVEITGSIANSGDRPLELIEINCVFYDPWGQVVLRERVPIVSRRMGGLAPGATKGFRLAFDNLPDSWNQGMPQLVIARILFG
jgi:hypothetical protein